MVAKIKSGKSIIGALNYNEHKVNCGKAELIEAYRYFKDPDQLSFNDKLMRLTDTASGNLRTRTNAVHISLNFAVNENLDNGLLTKISKDYMEQIGFGEQPFLVYKHSDAGHPHIHIVTTNIKITGERISLHMIGKTKSETARQNLEHKYNLQRALKSDGQKYLSAENRLSAVEYGATDTKRAITNIVNRVIQTYKFTSLPELNAILNSCNITADRGSKDSRMYAKNGLVYWILDKNGDKIGIPIKASSIYGKPTLKNLEKYFSLNEVLRKPHKENIRNIIDEVMKSSSSVDQFTQQLTSQGIQIIFRHNDDGQLYGITFVDHGSRSVFNGSDLGKEYSANTFRLRFGNTCLSNNNDVSGRVSRQIPDVIRSEQRFADYKNSVQPDSLLDILFKEGFEEQSAFGKFQQRKRKKKRKYRSL